jgi:DNA-binding MarR family transcriptional regulator
MGSRCYTGREYSQVVIQTVTEQTTVDPTQQAWNLFQQTSILVARYFESVTAQFGLSYPQTAVLTVLRLSGRPLPLSRVARMLTQEAQSTTELADRLERRNYVRRIRDSRDRRLVLLELTDEGNAAIDRILPALREARSQIFGVLQNRQLDQLTGLLLPLRDRAADRLGVDRERLRSAFELASGDGSAGGTSG